MSNASTITVQNVVDYGRAHVALKVMLGVAGINNEPGLSICNDILQYLMAKPFAWKFNRKIMPFFVTQAFVQDYSFAGACAFVLAPATSGNTPLSGGGVGIDLAGNSAITQSGSTVTVKCLQRHNMVVGQTVFLNNVVDQNGAPVTALNAVFTQDTNAMTSTWSNGFVITATPNGTSFQFSLVTSITPSGAPGITDIGWLESAALIDISNPGVPQPTGPIEAQDRIVTTHMRGETKQVCVQQDLGTGVVVMRVNPCADSYSYSVNCIYQARAKRLVKTQDTWDPWPDNLAYVLRAGMKAYAYDLADKPAGEKQLKMQAFFMAAQSALAYSDTENSNMGFAPSVGIMRG